MRRIVPWVALALASAVIGCLAAPQSVAHDVAHALIVGAVLVSVLAIASFLYHARRHHLLTAGLLRLGHPGALAGESVEFVPGLCAPLVAGLWRPRIFCAADLDVRLDADEIEAVILHERHHLLDRAPLRMVVVAALAPFIGRLGHGRDWLERERARVEIAADRYALAEGARRPVIARALVKLAPAAVVGAAPGFTSAADLRLRALLGEPTGLERGPSLAPAVAVVGLLLAACLAVFVS